MRIVKNNTEALLKKELTVPIEVEMTGNMVKKFLNGNIEWVTPITGLRFNASINSIALDVNMNLGMFGNQTLRIDKFYATYWSLQYVIGETVLTGEYTYQDIDGELMGNDVENNLEGFHLNITHRFTNWFEIGGYYSEYYYDSDDRDGNLYAPNNHMAWEKNYCLSTRFDINDYWLLKLETHYIDGTLFVTPDDKEKPDDLEPEFFLFAAKISYAF